jgi:ATP-binding cassette, subfamily B, bacterial PglK
MKSLIQFFGIFRKNEKIKLIFFFLLMNVTALIEAISIGLIFPFIAMITNPDLIHNNEILNFLFKLSSVEIEENFIVLIGFILVACFFAKNTFFLFSQYLQQNYIIKKRIALVGVLYRGYMLSDYEFHLNNNSALLFRNLAAVDGLFAGLLQPLFGVISESIIIIFITIMLVYTNGIELLFVLVAIGFIVLLINKFVSVQLSRLGDECYDVQGKVAKIILEGLSGIKEILVMKRHKFFVEAYMSESERMGIIRRDQVILSSVNRVVLEPILVAGIIMYLVYFLLTKQSIIAVLPSISIISVAAIRFMASINKIATGVNQLNFNMVLNRTIVKDIKSYMDQESLFVQDKSSNTKITKLDEKLLKNIQIDNIAFSYKNSNKRVINNISFNIKKGTSIGIIGSSGTGKSTLVEIIIGLLNPIDGSVLKDGTPIKSIEQSWSEIIGYIPQSIYLSDDTLRNNIAFGIPSKDITESSIESAIKLAKLEDVVSNLPEGLNTLIGDRGVRLSGGQRQRVAIARALYHDPEVIVMDEATSALDNETESEFMSGIQRITGKKTVIIVAHRLTTVKKCDVIYFLKDGKINAEGTLSELFEKSPEFRVLAKLDPAISKHI